MTTSPLSGYGRTATTLVAFGLGAWFASSGLMSSILSYWSDIAYLTTQHITLAAISCVLALLIGLPIGVAVTRPPLRQYADIVIQFINLGTTIPTLAVLAIAMSFLGIGVPPAIFGLTLLTLLPIVLNTAAGLSAVPAHLIEAARGMGMTGPQILRQVELPNAMFVILAGVRTAVAVNIGTVPLAFLVGGGGLGELIFTGIDLMEPSMLLAGAITTAALAIFADFLISQCQYWLIPKGINPLR